MGVDVRVLTGKFADDTRIGRNDDNVEVNVKLQRYEYW